MLEWQRLSEHYREMSEDELRQLAADFADLTSTAQQALRSEIRNRGLGDPQRKQCGSSVECAACRERIVTAPLPLRNAPSDPVDDIAFGAAFGPRAEIVPDTPYAGAEVDGPVEYTWKTPLCECDTLQEANELSLALKQAGIDNWIEDRETERLLCLREPRFDESARPRRRRSARAGARHRRLSHSVRHRRGVSVENSRLHAAFMPQMRAPDPVLEGVDPANSWKCDQCGQNWSDPVPGEPTEAGPPPAQPA